MPRELSFLGSPETASPLASLPIFSSHEPQPAAAPPSYAGIGHLPRAASRVRHQRPVLRRPQTFRRRLQEVSINTPVRCNLTVDATSRLLSVNFLQSSSLCAVCSVTYLDQGTGSVASAGAVVTANNATALDKEVEGLDPRLGVFSENLFGIRRRAVRLEIAPSEFFF
jgi:hypothetical protein